MKTKYVVRNFQANAAFLVFIILVLIFSLFKSANAQMRSSDPHLPGKRKFNVGLLTTYTNPAPALVAEMNFGVTNKVSLGAIGGTTGSLSLFGMRLNAQFYQKNNFRTLFRMTSIYYPERNGKYLFDRTDKYVMAWMLSMGFVDAEWKSPNGTRWTAGLGILETHCVEGMMNYLFSKEKSGKESPFDVFSGVHGSVSFPLSPRLTFRPEVIFVSKGFTMINPDEHKVRPLNIYLSLVYSF
jgi:hypothetical protein